MNPTETPVTKSPAEQLADIKAQAASIVSLAQKKDPNIKISAANAEMIGLPKVNIPTQTERKNRTTELDMVGTTPVPKTSTDIARETILSKVKPEDRDTIDQILGIATDYQTEKGKQYETQYTDLLQQQLGTATSARDRALESGKMKEAAQLPQLEAELESIRSEADVLEARRNSAIQAESRRSGVSTSAMQGNINAIDRDFNLEKANLAIRELASVGKINAATKLIEAKLDIKYGDLEAETELLTAQINAIKPFLDREDAKAADLRLQMNEIVKTSIADARAEDQALEEFKLQSYQFAQQNGATPALLSQIMSSTSRGDVLSVGGSFVQDPMQKLQAQQARENILTSQAQRANIYDQIQSRQDALRQKAEDEAKSEATAQQAIETQKQADAEQALNIKSLANELLTTAGLEAAVGVGFKKTFLNAIPFVSGEAVAGSDRANFEAKASRLANLLTIDNLKLMSGVLTDKDIEILASAGSNLGNMDMSETEYKKEINRIVSTMNRTINNNGITNEQAIYWGLFDQSELSDFNNIWESK